MSSTPGAPAESAVSGLTDSANALKMQLKSYVSQTDNSTLIHIIGCTLVLFIAGCIAY